MLFEINNKMKCIVFFIITEIQIKRRYQSERNHNNDGCKNQEDDGTTSKLSFLVGE
jgi:hypothetical protein